MRYKGITVLEPTAKWLKVDGTEYPKCSACGYLQDIWEEGSSHCKKCGAWMQRRYVRDKEDRRRE